MTSSPPKDALVPRREKSGLLPLEVPDLSPRVFAVLSGGAVGGALAAFLAIAALPAFDYLASEWCGAVASATTWILEYLTRGLLDFAFLDGSFLNSVLVASSLLPLLLLLGWAFTLPIGAGLRSLACRWPERLDLPRYSTISAGACGAAVLVASKALMSQGGVYFLPAWTWPVIVTVPFLWADRLLLGNPSLALLPASTSTEEAEPSIETSLVAVAPGQLRRITLIETLRVSAQGLVGGGLLTVWVAMIAWGWKAFGPLRVLKSALLFLSDMPSREIALWMLGALRGYASDLLGSILVTLWLWPWVALLARRLRGWWPGLPRILGMLLLVSPAAYLAWGTVSGLERFLDMWLGQFPDAVAMEVLVSQLYWLILGAGFLPNLLAAWLFLGPAEAKLALPGSGDPRPRELPEAPEAEV